MHGNYITGVGKAHNCCTPHRHIFNCRMYGTFNISVPGFDLTLQPDPIVKNGKQYWYVKLRACDITKYGWAIRDIGSNQRHNTLEMLTKKLLPEEFKSNRIEVSFPKKWSGEEIESWSENQYWFQSFPFSARKRADSQFVWDTINKIAWNDMEVLDIGCHYGFFSFKASEEGASVVGMDINKNSLSVARTIQEHIIQQDVDFHSIIPSKQFDIILYLSVHHQIDPSYENLHSRLAELKEKAKKHLFIELIIPPLFPTNTLMNEADIDKMVGGKVLARYKHNVRGHRKIYWVEV